MTLTINALSAAETAAVLRRKLGPAKAWPDFLSDCIRGRQTYHGLTLLPVCYIADRVPRPVYNMRDILAFVESALTRVGAPAAPAELRPLKVQIDAAALALPFGMRTGKVLPVARS